MSTDIRETDRGGTVKGRIREALDVWTYPIHFNALHAALTEIERLEGALRELDRLTRADTTAKRRRAEIRRTIIRALSDTEGD